MKRIIWLLFLSASVLTSAQKAETIKLNHNIKDKFSRTKSLTVRDIRTDKNIGTVTYKGEAVEIEFPGNDPKKDIEDWFAEDNKARGNNDIVILIEEIKVSEFKETQLAKARIKISSFISRNGRYYFINRYNNTMDFNGKVTSNVPKGISTAISTVLSALINDSYSHIAISIPVEESELANYEDVVAKSINYLNVPELRSGVYTDFRSFYLQKPREDYYVDKNRKGIVVGIKNRDNLSVSEEIFGYVENGKAYRLTPVGFLEMQKDENGFYIVSARSELFPPQSNNGMMMGTMMGGMVGALIGAAVDSSGSGRRNPNLGLSKIYIDSLTGDYIFK